MLAKAYSFALNGLESYLITIEVDVARGLPATTIVGLPDNAIKESKERVRSAIKNSEFEFPCARITINLAPADTKKRGPSFDLAIALGILAASEQISKEALERFAIIGELSLSGHIKPVVGTLPIALACSPEKFQGLILPPPNVQEGLLAQRTPIFSCDTLKKAIHIIHHPEAYVISFESHHSKEKPENYDIDMQEVKGQAHVKRGLEIASAGGHNALMIGPPGSGKTMLAHRIMTILPSLTREESLEITKIHSIAGTGKAENGLIWQRPFRTPHHTASQMSLVGGGTDPRPGEATLAHHGVLFLDELPEFSRHTLETLRQPLEDNIITISRVARTVQFPAQFMLLAAMNPCPCGHLGDRNKPCRCTTHDINRYLNKISGPLLDRIDIHLEVSALKTQELLQNSNAEKSSDIKKRVEKARQTQLKRLQIHGLFSNAHMKQKHIKKYCQPHPEGQLLLRNAIESLGLSARAYDKILKISRTIADLENQKEILTEHLAEAISYRCLDKTRI